MEEEIDGIKLNYNLLIEQFCKYHESTIESIKPEKSISYKILCKKVNTILTDEIPVITSYAKAFEKEMNYTKYITLLAELLFCGFTYNEDKIYTNRGSITSEIQIPKIKNIEKNNDLINFWKQRQTFRVIILISLDNLKNHIGKSGYEKYCEILTNLLNGVCDNIHIYDFEKAYQKYDINAYIKQQEEYENLQEKLTKDINNYIEDQKRDVNNTLWIVTGGEFPIKSVIFIGGNLLEESEKVDAFMPIVKNAMQIIIVGEKDDLNYYKDKLKNSSNADNCWLTYDLIDRASFSLTLELNKSMPKIDGNCNLVVVHKTDKFLDSIDFIETVRFNKL